MSPFKNTIYSLLCLSFSIIIGAAVYEHLSVWPKAFSAIPKSLTMFQGEYGLESAPFWMAIHPVTLILFLITLILVWRTERRKYVLFSLIGYVIVLITTFIYFVPELISLVTSNFQDSVDVALTKRGSRWEILSLVRLVFLIIIALTLNYGFSKSALCNQVSNR